MLQFTNRTSCLNVISLLLILIHFNVLEAKPSRLLPINPDDSVNGLNQNGVRIISEKNQIHIEGSKDYFLDIHIYKKVTFKILNKKGLERVQQISLPECFDSTYQRHFANARNYQSLFSSIKVDEFIAQTILSNGERSNKEVSHEEEIVKMTMSNDLYGEYKRIYYRVNDLNIGDEVEIKYSYTVPFDENALSFLSFRMFFNSTIFKEKYELTISHKAGLNVAIFDHNNAKPDSIFTKQKIKVYKWLRKDLEANLLEEGSRPYLSLPYIILSIKPISYSYRLPDSFANEFLPTYALYTASREYKHLSMIRSIDQGLKLKQFVLIDNFITENSTDIRNDTTAYNTLKQLKRLIAEDFTYLDDVKFFKGWDERDPRIGSHLIEGKIREISRYETYIAIIRKLKLNYYTAYLSDIRSGVLNNQYLNPMDDSDYLLAAITRDGAAQFIYPKTSDFGYYLNEYPFYFENAKARLIHLSDYRSNRTKINAELRQYFLPKSTYNDNFRRSNILAEVNLATKSILFKSKVDLSGQYSTMTRGLYKNNYRDCTVNPLYHEKVWNVSNDVVVIDSSLSIKNDEFPFNCSLLSNYKSNQLIENKKDTISIKLNGLMKHIIAKNIDPNNRTLDYYSDFLGSDLYNYVFKFDQNVKLVNPIKSINIKNSFGEYIFNISQLSPNSIKISSFLSILNQKVEAENIANVSNIFSEIKALSNVSLYLIVED